MEKFKGYLKFIFFKAVMLVEVLFLTLWNLGKASISIIKMSPEEMILRSYGNNRN